jgi:hypothetical protein
VQEPSRAEKTVLARGILARKGLEQSDGGAISAEAMARSLGETIRSLNDLRQAGQILAWPDSEGEWRYPIWQLDAKRKVLPGLRECMKALETSSQWEPLIFFLSPRESLDGQRPLDLLRSGRIDKAIAAAERHGGHGAY